MTRSLKIAEPSDLIVAGVTQFFKKLLVRSILAVAIQSRKQGPSGSTVQGRSNVRRGCR